MKWIVLCAFGMLVLASGQVVNQKLLGGDEPTSFLEADYDSICQSFGCDLSLKGNGSCDSSCNYWQCDYDGGDCRWKDCYEKRGCTKEIHGDGNCDYFCNNSDCEYDKGDCKNWD